MEIFYEGKRVKSLVILKGYCPDTSIPCEKCVWFNEKERRCTHEPISVSFIIETEDGNEETITLPLDVDDDP